MSHFTVQSEKEFYEDFSGWQITDDELELMLAEAREKSDVRLRRLIKQHQYFRFLMPSLLEIARRAEPENKFVELAAAVMRSTGWE